MFSPLSTPLRRRAALPVLALALVFLAGCDSAEEQAQKYYARAQSSLAAGDAEKAALDFRNAIRLRPAFIDARMGLAEADEKRHAFDEAVKIYGSIAAADPAHLESRLRLAQILLASRQVARAAQYAEECFRLKPEDPRVLAAKAGVALSIGNAEDARDLAAKSVRGDPSNMTAIMVLASAENAVGDREGAAATLSQAPAAAAANLTFQLLSLRILQEAGDEKRVSDLVASLPQRFPQSAELRDAIIGWYQKKGSDAGAEAAARRFTQDNPHSDEGQIRLSAMIRKARGAAAAANELRAAIARFPAADESALVSLRVALAGLDMAAGRPEASVASLRDVIASAAADQDRLKAELRLAQSLAAMTQWQEASELAGRVLAADQGNVAAREVRAMAHAAMGRDAEAVEDLFAALGVSPNEPDLTLQVAQAYERMGSAALADEHYAKSLAFSGYAAPNGIKYARFLLRYGRKDEALRVLQDLKLRGAADRTVLSLLAQVKLDQGDWAGAQDAADALRALPPPDGPLAADRVTAAVLIGTKRPEEAVALLTRALAQSPSNPDLQVDLADATLAAGRQADAEALYRKAAAADGPGTAATEALAKFYLRTGNAEEAERVARDGLSRNSRSIGLRLVLARVLEKRDAIDAAITEYEAVVASDPTSTVAANNLASLLLERNAGREDRDRAFALASRLGTAEVPEFLDTLGWSLYARGAFDEALPLLKRAADRASESGAIQYHLGMVLKELGQEAQSRTALRQAVALAPAPDARYLRTAEAALAQLGAATSQN